MDSGYRASSFALKTRQRQAGSYYNRATYYLKLDNCAEAITDFTEAIRLKPDYVNAYCNRGSAYHKQDKLAEVITDYIKAIDQWRYENECRFVHMMQGDDAALKQPYVLRYDQIGIKLKAIYFGTECGQSQIDEIKAIIEKVDKTGKIELHKMTNDGVNFELKHKPCGNV